MTQSQIILIVYLVLLVAGGLMGFIKAKSKASLIMSVTFAVLLALFEFALTGTALITNILLAFLLVFFAMRFVKGRKFMPAGLMTILTLIVLILRFI